jgi:hypothetical protein
MINIFNLFSQIQYLKTKVKDFIKIHKKYENFIFFLYVNLLAVALSFFIYGLHQIMFLIVNRISELYASNHGLMPVLVEESSVEGNLS